MIHRRLPLAAPLLALAFALPFSGGLLPAAAQDAGGKEEPKKEEPKKEEPKKEEPKKVPPPTEDEAKEFLKTF